MQAPLQAPLQQENQSDAVQKVAIRPARREGSFVDNRPTAVAQRKLAAMINHSPRVLLQQKAQIDAIHNSPRMLAQRQKMDALFGGKANGQEDETLPAQLARLPALEHAAIQKKPNNTGLPDNLKVAIENLSGYALDDVKVHYNSDKPAQLQAHAYAQGADIYLRPGKEKHLAHEAWHVVQQKQGRVKPTVQMKGGVSLNDDAGLEREADLMGTRAEKDYSASCTNNSFSAETGDTGSMQLKSITFRPVVQRWIMMAHNLRLDDVSPEDPTKEVTLKDHIKKTSALFEPNSKKPIDRHFGLLSKFEDAEKNVAKALKFLNIKHKRAEEGYITIEDVAPLLRSWMGVVPDYSVENEINLGIVKDEMTNEVLGPKTGPKQYDIRAASEMPAEMRYYVTFEELAWALVQASGLQAAPNMFDDYYAEIAVAKSVSISANMHANLKSALKKIFTKVAEINEMKEMKGDPDYASFHKIKTWGEFKEKYEQKYTPDSFVGLISVLHDIKSYFAISKHPILSEKPEDIVVRGSKKEGGSSLNKKGDVPMNFPEEIRINKEDMRYNLGTVDEADPFVLFMRERGRSLWAAPSFTTVSMLEIVKKCDGNKDELTSVAYGIFAFWCIHYPHTATPIHTFHEVMAAAQAYNVAYDPNESVVGNANKEGLLRSRSF